MCGFTGYWSKDLSRGRGREFLEESCRLQKHRGPDNSGVLIRGQTGIGFVRLSILDLETGMQPVINRADGTAIACNGQIYNYIELKDELPREHYATTGDMEVALNAYRHHGPGFPAKLNGMFAGVVHDPERNRLVLFRDRFGIKPLYYVRNGSGLFFSSEIKPLLKAPGVPRELDPDLLAAFFKYRYVPGERTIFKGIRKLPPASVLIQDTLSGDFSLETYWQWKFDENRNITSSEAGEEFNRLFTDSVKIRLRSDVEVGSLISGGIDSSAVASAAAVHKPDIKLFTIGFSEPKYDETPDVDRFLSLMPRRFEGAENIRGICSPDHLGMLPEIINAIEEPISLGTMVPTDQVCRLASSRLKVVLTGEGADEIFAGYRKFLVEAAAMAYPGASSVERKRLSELYPEMLTRVGGTPEDHITRHIAGELLFSENELAELLGADFPLGFTISDYIPEGVSRMEEPISAMQVIETLTRLPNYVNLRLDKLSMRHSLETRTPFLDYRLAEFAGTLPLDLRVNLAAGREKFICRESFRTHGILPPEVTSRAKKPFTMPIADWFTTPSGLPDPIADILMGREVDAQGILNGDLVRKYAGMVTGEGVGPETMVSAGDRVFAIVVFTLWYGDFMKGVN